MPKAIIVNHDKTVDFSPATSLLNNFNILEVPIGSQCGGRGNCGKCRFRVLKGDKSITPVNDAEKFRLTKDELNDGWRLSCQAHAIGTITIFIPKVEKENI